MPRVSVIIPTYNRAEFVQSAVTSVLNQTFVDFEVIVVDNGSTDDTKSVVECLSDERVKYYRLEKNNGVSPARNFGIKNSSAKFVAFLDDDDEWLPEKLAAQVDLIERSPSVVGCVYTGYLTVARATNKIVNQVTPSKKGDLSRELCMRNCVGTASTVLLKRECMEKVGMFDESIYFGEEYDLWLRMSQEWHFEYIKEPLVVYYLHQTNASSNYDVVIRDLERRLEKQAQLYGSNRKAFSYRYLELGQLYCYTGKTKEGRQALITAIGLYPFKARPYYNLCLALLGAANYKRFKDVKERLSSGMRESYHLVIQEAFSNAAGKAVGVRDASRRAPAMTRATGERVAVVIPVYNRRASVRRAIESVLAQTHQNFEVIVVDDASTDGTAAAVAAIADPRIRVIRHERNRGGSAARNTGVRASSARYVAFLDSDDEWHPAKLARQLERFACSRDHPGLVYVGSECVFSDGSVSRRVPRHHDDLARALLISNVVGGASVGMVRRDVLDTLGGFDESLPSSQDLDLWLRVSERFGVAFVPDMLASIASGNDDGRISANIAGVIKGRELFCRKHRERLTRTGVLHLYLRDTGWVHHRENADRRLARRCYRESIAVRPVAPLTYVLLLVSYLPISWLDRVAHCRHLLSGLLGFGHEAWLAGGTHRSMLAVRLRRKPSRDSAAS